MTSAEKSRGRVQKNRILGCNLILRKASVKIIYEPRGFLQRKMARKHRSKAAQDRQAEQVRSLDC